MKQYIFKRVLVMIPTLFLITLVVFVILQLAPGKPGGPAVVDSESANQTQQAGFMIFKQQFHLDKPVILNLRFFMENSISIPFTGFRIGISPQDVEELLDKAINTGRKHPTKEMVWAIEALEDYGNSIIPQLARLIQYSDNPKTVREALSVFSRNARLPLIHVYGKQLTEDQRLENREIEAENRRIALLVYQSGMTGQEVQELRDKVLAYYHSVSERWDYSFLNQMRQVLFETRFAYYLKNLITLDFGISHVDKRPVLPKIMDRLGYSVVLSTLSIFLAYLIAIPIGIYSAVRPKSLLDQGLTVTLFMLYSLPTFFVGTLLLFYFSEGGEYFKWFPTGGYQSITAYNLTTLERLVDIAWHLVLPLICLTYVSLASISRYARAGLMDVIHADYVKTARAKGLHEFVVIFKHAVRNGLIPILTLLGTILPTVVSGSVIIEVIFNIPGIGLESYNAVKLRDYNMVMAIQLISAVLTLIGLLISDILYCIVDPRISYE